MRCLSGWWGPIRRGGQWLVVSDRDARIGKNVSRKGREGSAKAAKEGEALAGGFAEEDGVRGEGEGGWGGGGGVAEEGAQSGGAQVEWGQVEREGLGAEVADDDRAADHARAGGGGAEPDEGVVGVVVEQGLGAVAEGGVVVVDLDEAAVEAEDGIGVGVFEGDVGGGSVEGGRGGEFAGGEAALGVGFKAWVLGVLDRDDDGHGGRAEEVSRQGWDVGLEALVRWGGRVGGWWRRGWWRRRRVVGGRPLHEGSRG